MLTVKALVRVCGCTGLSEPVLLCDMISTKSHVLTHNVSGDPSLITSAILSQMLIHAGQL